MAQVAIAAPPPPGLQEATKNSTQSWQDHLHTLFKLAKDRFPDVVWDVGEGPDSTEEVWGHKAIVYARAPPTFQSRYFALRQHNALYDVDQAADSALSLDPSTYGTSEPSTATLTHQPSSSLLRINALSNPALFANELEYLYTGKGFGEAFEFLFDASEAREHDPSSDAESLRIDKLRKDLVFMWRSRLFSDVRIALTDHSSSSSSSGHESTTAIFSSHRFILVSRSPYFYDALLSWPTKPQPPGTAKEIPIVTLPSPPFTPASLHFTLGFLYTGTLVFSHRTYDLSTAFGIMRAALFLSLPSLHDEIQARIVQEMLHGLFHAFIPFAEYERLTGGRWGTGGCRCRQCARRAPRVLEFALEEDVKNPHLERGARRALVGHFGEGWATQEFASLAQKHRESVLKGLGKRTTPTNVFPILFAAEHALTKLGSVIDSWGDVSREMIFSARKVVDEVLTRESEKCFESEEWMEIMSGDGVRFEDGERVEWAMAAVLRGVKEQWAPSVYQTLVSSILLRPHPTEGNASMLSATSHIRVQVEQTRVELLKWIGKRWLEIRNARGFDALDGWALKEISDDIEVPIDDLLSPPAYTNTPHGSSTSTPRHSGHRSPNSSPNANNSTASAGSKHRNTRNLHQHLLRPISQHPHTSKVEPDSDAGSSMRMSVLSRSVHSAVSRADRESLRESVRERAAERERESQLRSSTTSGAAGYTSAASSIRSVARSDRTVGTARKTSGGTPGTPGKSPAQSRTGSPLLGAPADMSPAKMIARDVRAGKGLSAIEGVGRMKERPDSKMAPVESDLGMYKGDGDDDIGEERGEGDGDEGEEGYAQSEAGRTDDAESVYGGEGGEGDEMQEGDGDGDMDMDRQSNMDLEEGDEDTKSFVSSVSRRTTNTTNTTKTTGTARSTRTGASANTGGTQTPLKKTLITRASLASVQSRVSTKSGSPGTSRTPSNPTGTLNRTPTKASNASIRTTGTARSRVGSAAGGTPSRSPNANAAGNNQPSRPVSRGSTRSRLTISTTGGGTNRASTLSTSTRPTSSISTLSTLSATTDSGMTYRTASTGGGVTPLSPNASVVLSPGGIRSRTTSVTSNVSVRTAGASPVRSRSGTGAGGATGAPGERKRTISGASVSSVASTTGSVRSTTSPSVRKRVGRAPPPVPVVDPAKLSPATAVTGRISRSVSSQSVTSRKGAAAAGATPVKRSASEKDGGKKVAAAAVVGLGGKKDKPVLEGAKEEVEKEKEEDAEDVNKDVEVEQEAKRDEERGDDEDMVVDDPDKTMTMPVVISPPQDNRATLEPPKEDVLPNTSSTLTIRPTRRTHSDVSSISSGSSVSSRTPTPSVIAPSTSNEHKKSDSSASTTSVATVKRKGSNETIRTIKSGPQSPPTGDETIRLPTSLPLPPIPISAPSSPTPPSAQPILTASPGPAQPSSHSIAQVLADDTPPGATLEIGIPCIISLKRKRFKAYARYIGEVIGEDGPWVGVEVPMPLGDNHSSLSLALGGEERISDERQWNDGTWGGIRYFEIGGMGSEYDFGGNSVEERAARRRRVDGGSGSSTWMMGKGMGKREGDALSIASERMKRMRSASPAVSDMSGTETRGLFVRPQHVLYVVDAVGADL
ncbi:hypothetical protein BJ165DRAFT_1535704 [Panaeolus papilionaceus]|nr:hypothetical protein BJ165DRAFT_1535704 [Panaeolus papilionaceus]